MRALQLAVVGLDLVDFLVLPVQLILQLTDRCVALAPNRLQVLALRRQLLEVLRQPFLHVSGLLQLLLEAYLLLLVALQLGLMVTPTLPHRLLHAGELERLALDEVLQVAYLDLQWLELAQLLVNRRGKTIVVQRHVRSLHHRVPPQLLVDCLELADLVAVDLFTLLEVLDLLVAAVQRVLLVEDGVLCAVKLLFELAAVLAEEVTPLEDFLG